MFFAQRFNKPFRLVLVSLSSILIWGLHLKECIRILSELELYSSGTEDTEGTIWYYGQSLFFHSQLGYTIVSYQQCRKFYEENSIRYREFENSIGGHRLNALLWLWCIRNERWEEAKTYTSDINQIMKETSKMNPNLLYIALIVTEGYLLYLVHKLDQMNIFDIPKTIAKIRKLFVILDKYAKIFIVAEPNVLILKAYYLHIQNEDVDCFKLMEEALKISRKHENLYHEKFGQHLIKAWKKQLPEAVVNFWKTHSDEDNLLNFDILEGEDDVIGFFTYPTPKYNNIGIFTKAGNMKKKKLKKLKLT